MSLVDDEAIVPLKPQNLLFLLSDQHSKKALGCAGHPLVRTPNLDRLAARGTLFRNAYCNSPICVPSRASLATGRYVFDIGYWDNARPYEGSAPSWGHRLAHHGHRVESIGKLHFRSAADPTGFAEQHLPMHVVGGSGDLLGSLRDGSAMLAKYRGYHENAGPGESTYTAYDRKITAAAVDWLGNQAPRYQDRPWVLFASLVCPHPPLLAPEDFYALYPPERMPWPTDHDPGRRPEHPALGDLRRFMGIDEPFSEDMVRRSISAYFGLCSFLDDNLGQILGALEASGLAQTTRIIYSSDHGESNGNQGLWGKSNMYEDSAGVPLIVAGEGVPEGLAVNTPVSLVDVYPSVLDCVGLERLDDDRHLPGRSLFDLAAGADPERLVFGEFHAAASNTGIFMVRRGDMKYVHYVGYPPQLFDLAEDPEETADLAADPAYDQVREDLDRALREIVDPEAVDARAKADQAARIAAAGGRRAILEKGSFGYTPAPGEAAVYR